MIEFKKGSIFAFIVALIVMPALGITAAMADDNGLTDTLKVISSDKSEKVELRRESILALRSMEAKDADHYSAIGVDKDDTSSLRVASLGNLSLSGPSDATVQQTLKTIILDKTDDGFVRAMAVNIAASQPGMDLCGLRDEIRQVCLDAEDETSVRVEAVAALAGSLDAAETGNLLTILGNAGDDTKVRVTVLDSLKGSPDEAYLACVKTLVTTKVSEEGERVSLSFSGSCSQFRLRLKAISVASTYLANSGVAASLKAVALDTADGKKARLGAIHALGGDLVQTSATETLIDIVDAESDLVDVRIAALSAVCRKKTDAGYSFACDYVADTGADVKLRECALGLLAQRIPRARYIGYQLRLSPGEAWDDCSAAAVALLNLAREQGVETELRVRAVAVLRWTTDPGALQALRDFVQDKSVEAGLRIKVARALSLDGGSISVLEGIANSADEDQDVKDAAAAALKTARQQ